MLKATSTNLEIVKGALLEPFPSNEAAQNHSIGVVQMSVFRRGSVLIIKIHGSNEIRDWFYNLYATTSVNHFCGRKCRIHRGYWLLYSAIRQTVRSIVQSSQGQVIFLGHSKGGALASIAFVDCADLPQANDSTLFSFGAPKFGDAAFCNMINKHQAVHFYNRKDPVIYFPCCGFTKSPPTRKCLVGESRGCWFQAEQHGIPAYLGALERLNGHLKNGF